MKVPRKLYFTLMSISFVIGIIMIANDMQPLGWTLEIVSVMFLFLATQPEKVCPEETKKYLIGDIVEYQNKHEIKFDKTYFTQSNKTNISFSHDEGLLYLFNTLPSFNVKIIDCQDIVESHLIGNDDTVITKTARANQIGGILVGGALLGAGGAIVAGLSSKKTSSNVIKNLELKIIVNDLNNPVITIPIKDTDDELAKSSPVYKELYDKGYEIHKTLSLIIKQQEEKQNSII